MSPKKLDDQKLIQFLNQKWGNAKCPLCGHGNWNVDTNIVTLINATDGVMQVGGNYLPLVPVTCMNCGNTILVNAVVSNAFVDTGNSEGGNGNQSESK